MSTHKRITNLNMRFPKRKSSKTNNMSQLFFSKVGFDNFVNVFLMCGFFDAVHVKTISSN